MGKMKELLMEQLENENGYANLMSWILPNDEDYERWLAEKNYVDFELQVADISENVL